MIPALYSTRNQGWLPSLFNDFFSENWISPKFSGTTPAINVSEDENEYHVEVAAPGMTKDDFHIIMTEDGDIVISMEKKFNNKEEQKDMTYLRREFSYSKFVQRLHVPDNVERENITAAMNDGILYISIPKKKEFTDKEARAIEIK